MSQASFNSQPRSIIALLPVLNFPFRLGQKVELVGMACYTPIRSPIPVLTGPDIEQLRRRYIQQRKTICTSCTHATMSVSVCLSICPSVCDGSALWSWCMLGTQQLRQPVKLKPSYDLQQTWPPPILRLLTSTK